MSAGDDALDLAVDALAAYRLTRLVTTDKLTAPARDKVLARCRDRPTLRYLVTCSWCVGVWAAVIACAARSIAPRTWGRIARAGAVATIVGVLSER